MTADDPKLPRHGDLVFRGATPAKLGPALDAHLVDPWTRAREIEDDWSGTSTRPMVFDHRGEGDLPGALLFVFEEGATRLAVANIVPKEAGQLSEAQYNAILTDFHDRIALEAAEDVGATIELDTADYDLAERAGQGVRDRLATFSRGANRSTGTSHPMDKRRFFDFVIAVHDLPEDRRPGVTTISEWLIADGWPGETAWEVGIEFEQGLALLDHYTGNG